MAIALASKARSRLIDLLSGLLPGMLVAHNAYIDLPSAGLLNKLDEVIPQHGKASPWSRLRRLINDRPVTTFVLNELNDRLKNRGFEHDRPAFPLLDIPEFADPVAASTSLIDSVLSLPFQYQLLVPVPAEVGALANEIAEEGIVKLGRGVSLQAMDAEGSYPMDTTPELAVGFAHLTGYEPRPSGVVPNRVYLVVSIPGYIPSVESTGTLEDALLLVRGCFGLLRALGLAGPTYAPLGTALRNYYLVYRHSDTHKLVKVDEVGSAVSTAVAQWVLNPKLGEYPRENVQIFARAVASRIRAVLESGESGSPVVRSAAWLLDSETGGDRNMSFVQAAVAVEILLGDKSMSDLIGLGELLGNRCAYLIGRSTSDRADILKSFKRVYETRSRIVHAGHEHLSMQEREDLYLLRWMALRAIQEEVKLLAADAASA